jgi:hypothetical protein
MGAESDSSQPSNGEPNEAVARSRALGRWQFSLRGLLLFVLLVAMGLSLAVTARRMLRAEAELAEYRRECGILKVENPTMLHAVALWTPEPGRWRWRVHLPPGRYDLCWSTTGIPLHGLPKPEHGISDNLPAELAGFADVSAVAYKDPLDGVWKYRVSFGCIAMSQRMPVSLPNESAWQTFGIQCGDEPAIVSPAEPLVLLRKRVVEEGNRGVSFQSDLDVTDGLMLWIRRMGEASRQAGQGASAW